jgi:hypothetical protein
MVNNAVKNLLLASELDIVNRFKNFKRQRGTPLAFDPQKEGALGILRMIAMQRKAAVCGSPASRWRNSAPLDNPLGAKLLPM